jgi:hypothetical protein
MFKEVWSEVISNNYDFDNNAYKIFIAVVEKTNDDGSITEYVDIRSYWVNEEKKIPTKMGVMLTLEEFNKMAHYRTKKKFKGLVRGNRQILFEKMEKSDRLFKLILRRNGTEDKYLILNNNEIESISKIKMTVNNNCKK